MTLNSLRALVARTMRRGRGAESPVPPCSDAAERGGERVRGGEGRVARDEELEKGVREGTVVDPGLEGGEEGLGNLWAASAARVSVRGREREGKTRRTSSSTSSVKARMKGSPFSVSP